MEWLAIKNGILTLVVLAQLAGVGFILATHHASVLEWAVCMTLPFNVVSLVKTSYALNGRLKAGGVWQR